jgi:peptidoglycan/LPS O-acetylase OafA/YrhL
MTACPAEDEQMLRSVTGVVAGYLLFAVSAFTLFRISGRDPHQEPDLTFAVLSILWGMVFAFAGGYAAGTIAGRRPRLHGGVVALILALGATASFLAEPGEGSRWSQAALALMAPAALLGGIAREGGRRG